MRNAFPNCGLQIIHINRRPHLLCLNLLTLHSQPSTEHQAPKTPNSGTSLQSHLDSKMLFTSQHLALLALAGLNALAAAQSPSNQTQATQSPVRADRPPPFIGGWKTDDSLSILRCALTVARSAPCFAVAIATANPLALLSCVSKDQVRLRSLLSKKPKKTLANDNTDLLVRRVLARCGRGSDQTDVLQREAHEPRCRRLDRPAVRGVHGRD
jgi:hypothetical protein